MSKTKSERPASPRRFPRIRRTGNKALWAVLLSLRGLIQCHYSLTRDRIIESARLISKGIKTQRVDEIQDAIQTLIDDAVLVDSFDRDGTLKLDLSRLEEQMEVYNETP